MTTEYDQAPCRIVWQGGFFMEGTWKVYLDGQVVGSCALEHRGLYCEIACRCSHVAEGICRLMLHCGEEELDLGVLIPGSGGFVLERRIPVKRLPKGQPRFSVVAQQRREEGTFVPVHMGEAFEYLSKLENARLARRDGEVGLLLP